MSLEFRSLFVGFNGLDPESLCSFGAQDDRNKLIYSLRGDLGRLQEVKLHEEGGLRILKDVEVTELTQPMRQPVRCFLYAVFHLNPENLTVVFFTNIIFKLLRRVEIVELHGIWAEHHFVEVFRSKDVLIPDLGRHWLLGLRIFLSY